MAATSEATRTPTDPVWGAEAGRRARSGSGTEMVVGIDFGTSTTVTAIGHGPGTRIVDIDGRGCLPSVVFADDDDSLRVGWDAEDLLVGRPARGLRRAKTLLGRDTPVVLGGRTYPIAELVAAILRAALAAATDELGRAPERTCVTAQPDWGDRQRAQFRAALARAHLADAELVPEPIAAAYGLAPRAPMASGRPFVLYDLGSGTLDVTVLQWGRDGFTMIGDPRADDTLGGDLFDDALLEHVGRRLPSDAWERLRASDDPAWERAMGSIRAEVRRAKELLAHHRQATLNVPIPGRAGLLRLDRSELDTVLRPFVVASAAAVVRALGDAAVPVAELGALCLSGGGSTLPLVSEVLAEAFPTTPVLRTADPKGVVATGAVIALTGRRSRAGRVGPPAPPRSAPPTRPVPSAPPSPCRSVWYGGSERHGRSDTEDPARRAGPAHAPRPVRRVAPLGRLAAVSAAIVCALVGAGVALLHWSRPDVVTSRPTAPHVAPAAVAAAGPGAATPAATSR